jgi:hypothetical protein
MTNDPIVEEVHRIREQMLAEYDGDIHALIQDARRRTEEEARAGRKVYSPPPRKPGKGARIVP